MMDNWDLMQNWYLVLPPSRPSALQLARIQSQIDIVDRALPVAVLGSTPEFRDLLYECGFSRIYVFDRNQSFHQAMTKARVHQNAEHFINKDWLESLPTFNGVFAAILSDLTSGNIAYNERSVFYQAIDNALMKSGMFFDKVLTHPDQLLSVDGLIEKYAKLPLNLLHINHFSSEMFFCSELIDLDHVVDSSLFYRILSGRVRNDRVRAFVENAKKITPPSCKWWYGRRWAELTIDYCPRLGQISVAEDEPSSPYYRYLKFFQFRKGD